ncbi:hypothetical protein NW759_009433 [Fusarium solani]|nr:hypothetical protein NW759_009433 [Fusarium solani]
MMHFSLQPIDQVVNGGDPIHFWPREEGLEGSRPQACTAFHPSIPMLVLSCLSFPGSVQVVNAKQPGILLPTLDKPTTIFLPPAPSFLSAYLVSLSLCYTDGNSSC